MCHPNIYINRTQDLSAIDYPTYSDSIKSLW